MRVAFTIILNGYNHLIHNNYYQQVTEMFDLWVIVEGVSNASGSTSWCNNLSDKFHKNFLSNDGTTELLDKMSSNSKVKIVRSKGGYWSNKDEQVNAAIDEILKYTNKGKLWQIDIDEQWDISSIVKAENELDKADGKTGCFLSNFYVGKNQIAKGQWGEGTVDPYRRLWNWSGERFLTHEPPKLAGRNGPGLLLTPRFNHYAYYYDEDVVFKEAYYGSYEGLYNRWQKIQSNRSIIPVRELLGDKIWWSNTNTLIHYMPLQ